MFLKSVFGFVFCILLVVFGLTDKLQKKVDKVIKSTFEIEVFSMDAKLFSKEITGDLPSKFSDNNFFEIKKEDILLGYA